MYITAFFTNDGTPETGLSPTIRIRDVSDNSLVITDAAMTEVGDGWYKYDFSTYDSTKDYAIRCDGGSGLADADRYLFSGNENYYEDVRDGILDDATRFNGADIDVSISSRSSHTSGDVDTQLSGTHGAGTWISADVTGLDSKLDTIITSLLTIDGNVNNIETIVTIIEKLTGHDVTKSGDIITIYESEDGSATGTWRQYDLSNGGRLVV